MKTTFKSILFIFILLLLFSGEIFPSVIIKAKNSEYSGETVTFFKITDPVTLNKEVAFSLNFDSEGSASHQFSSETTVCLLAEFGIYRGRIVVQPEEEIELLFPPKRVKSFADEKNPYFEPVEFWFATKPTEQITNKISTFDKKFNQLTDKYFNLLYFRQSKEVFDSVTYILNDEFSNPRSELFAVHKKLKLKSLETDAFRLNTNEASYALNGINEEYWTLPSFIELFGKIFSNKLSHEIKAVDNKQLLNAIGRGQTDYLLKFVREKYGLEDKTANLVLLKMLHDGYYSGEFSENTILSFLKPEALANSNYPIIRGITKDVIDKLEFLQKGSKAPEICLYNIDGFQVCTDTINDKYKYIVFADTEMMVCREHLKYLEVIQQKFQKYLQIVVVLRKTDLIEMKMFLVKQKIPGIKLIDENNEYVEKYKVRSFPVAFLLSENHDVVFEHTKTPLDGFEQQFGPYLQRKLFMNQRNQSR